MLSGADNGHYLSMEPASARRFTALRGVCFVVARDGAYSLGGGASGSRPASGLTFARIDLIGFIGWPLRHAEFSLDRERIGSLWFR